MDRLTLLLLLILAAATGCSSTPSSSTSLIPSSVVEACTSSEEIYNLTSIPVSDGLGQQQIRATVLNALGKSQSNPSFVSKTFVGQWFFEHENDDAIFVGYRIRSHYLGVAIVISDSQLHTIICNSTNLRQSKNSIHKKAPVWKGTLDTNLRIAIGKKSLSQDNKY